MRRSPLESYFGRLARREAARSLGDSRTWVDWLLAHTCQGPAFAAKSFRREQAYWRV